METAPVDLAKWFSSLALRTAFNCGWLMTPTETVLMGSSEHYLEQPEQWSGHCPPHQVFQRNGQQAIMVSYTAPDDKNLITTVFVQRTQAWKPNDIDLVRDQILSLNLSLAYQQLKERLEQFQQQVKEDSKLLGLSHMAARLGKQLTETLGRAQKHLETQPESQAAAQISEAKGLAEQLLAYARRPAGNMERLLLHKILEDALNAAQSSFEEHSVLVSLESPLPVTVLGRGTEVRRLISELLMLSMPKVDGRSTTLASEASSPYVEVQLLFDAQDARLKISSQNDSPLENPEFQVCQEIARQNQGELSAEQLDNQSVWTLRFPLAVDSTSDTTNLPTESLQSKVVVRVPYVCVTNGPLSGTVFRLEQSEVQMGRSEDCQIVLPYNGVSRLHAVLEVSPPNKVKLRDLKSTNGVFVNAQRVDEQLLMEGDTIGLGTELELIFGYR
jgi:hypothetical protein